MSEQESSQQDSEQDNKQQQDAEFDSGSNSSSNSSSSSSSKSGSNANPSSEAGPSALTITTLVYALQALTFLSGITFVVAVVLNYVKKDDVKGTWLESHFRWQIRTFWFAVLWGVIGFFTWVVVIGMVIWAINTVWIIYRIVRGWLNLAERKPMYS